MNINHLLLILSVAIFQFSCSSTEETNDSLLTKNNINKLSVIDFGNDNNSSDLIVLLSTEIDPSIDEIIVFVSQPNDVIDTEVLNALSNSNSVSVLASQEDHEIKFNTGMSDVNGSPIQNGNEYMLRVAHKGGTDFFLDSKSESFTLTDVFYLNGRYTGVWEDNVFTGGVSADLELIGAKLQGIFWFTNNYMSCCDGPDADDGRVSFEILNDMITDCSLSQQVDNYNGGACNGNYQGSGQIEGYKSIIINFTGDDCDGSHDGRFRLNRDINQ